MHNKIVLKEYGTTTTYVVGDIHGEFNLLKNKIRNLENSLIILAGDCGLGFHKEGHYKDIFQDFNRIMTKNNSYLIMIRGNHDDPSYFETGKVNTKRVLAIPDYSVIELDDTNILCIGGAISIDRIYRLNKEEERKRTYSKSANNKLYWSNEFPIYNEQLLEEIVINYGDSVEYVITHTTPSFAPKLDKSGISEWMKYDEKLSIDLYNERGVFDKVYHYLLMNNVKIKKWFYGHFHDSETYTSNEGVEFHMLDMARSNRMFLDIIPINHSIEND